MQEAVSQEVNLEKDFEVGVISWTFHSIEDIKPLDICVKFHTEDNKKPIDMFCRGGCIGFRGLSKR